MERYTFRRGPRRLSRRSASGTQSDNFPEEGRICYLDGELFIDMGHERISSHVFLKTAIAKALDDLVDELGLGRFIADGVRIVNDKGNFSAEPDGCYFNWDAVDSGRITLRRATTAMTSRKLSELPTWLWKS